MRGAVAKAIRYDVQRRCNPLAVLEPASNPSWVQRVRALFSKGEPIGPSRPARWPDDSFRAMLKAEKRLVRKLRKQGIQLYSL